MILRYILAQVLRQWQPRFSPAQEHIIDVTLSKTCSCIQAWRYDCHSRTRHQSFLIKYARCIHRDSREIDFNTSTTIIFTVTIGCTELPHAHGTSSRFLHDRPALQFSPSFVHVSLAFKQQPFCSIGLPESIPPCAREGKQQLRLRALISRIGKAVFMY